MFIIIDTQEQKPLEFKKDGVIEGTETAKLDVGDYAARYSDGRTCCELARGNSEMHAHWERKSIADLFGTLTQKERRRRFKEEVARAHQSGVLLILGIEGSISRVLKGHRYSRRAGIEIYRQLNSLWIKYAIQPRYCRTRVGLAWQIGEYYAALGRLYYKKKKN